jgi:hypothetical protein
MLGLILAETTFPIIGLPSILSHGHLVAVEFHGDQASDTVSGVELTFGNHFDSALWIGVTARHDLGDWDDSAKFLRRLGNTVRSTPEKRTDVVMVDNQQIVATFLVSGGMAAGVAKILIDGTPYTVRIGSRQWGIHHLTLKRLSAREIAAIATSERTPEQARASGLSRFGVQPGPRFPGVPRKQRAR